MNEHFNQFLDILSVSLSSLPNEALLLPVAGIEGGIQRERAYCAELVHAIRLNIGDLPYHVTVEPNKKRHPYIEEVCGAVDPDFIVHRPGEMNDTSNLAVIEVKRSNGNLSQGINKDLQTITCMTTIKHGYYAGLIIVFGSLSNDDRDELVARIERGKNDQTQQLVFVHHQSHDTEPVFYCF